MEIFFGWEWRNLKHLLTLKNIYIVIVNIVVDCNLKLWYTLMMFTDFIYKFLFAMLTQTDTASVLSEAIEYIKFLHEQVTVSPISLYFISKSLKR
jgi:hypothetical protein